jgi:hypothetical protein
LLHVHIRFWDFPVVEFDLKAQLRHSARCTWPRYLAGGSRAEILRVEEHLGLLGYTGCIACASADSILSEWRKAGWVEVSPDSTRIRLTPKGEEQLAQWLEEDRLWDAGQRGDLELPKRLKAGQPATNLRRVSQVIGNRTVDGIHDPYTRVASLQNLLKLSELGTGFSPRLRLLGATLSSMDSSLAASFVRDLNTEKRSQWEFRTYSASQKPHRRFLVCSDGTIITCGLSLNNLDKDEALDVIPAKSKLAEHDRQFFDEKWKQGVAVK